MNLSHSFPQFLPAHFGQYINLISLFPYGLSCGSGAHRFLGLRVRIPPGACMSVVNVVCFQVEVSATGRSLIRRSHTDCGVSEYDRKATGSEQTLAHWERRGVAPCG